MYKEYKVCDSKTGEELEGFSTLAAAEEFMILMQSKGKEVTIKTDKDDVDEGAELNIEGLDIEEPSADFGSELDDAFGEDSDFGGFEVDSDDEDLQTE